MGFSANSKYSTTRCETFNAYMTGKQALLNDNFAGQSGFYMYEEMPMSSSRKSGVIGRGIEGFFDSFLKVFGI